MHATLHLWTPRVSWTLQYCDDVGTDKMDTCFDLDKMKLEQVTPRSVQRLSQSLWFFQAALEKTDIVKAVGVPPYSHPLPWQ